MNVCPSLQWLRPKQRNSEAANTIDRRQWESERSRVINTTQAVSSPLSWPECAFVTAAYSHTVQAGLWQRARRASLPGPGMTSGVKAEWTAWQQTCRRPHTARDDQHSCEIWQSNTAVYCAQTVFYNILSYPSKRFGVFLFSASNCSASYTLHIWYLSWIQF